MELILFKTFQVVVETGSFTTAAKRLRISQSAVSRRVKQLEDHYQIELLDRSQEPASPTQAGSLVLQKARQILEVEKEMKEEVASLEKGKRIGFCCTPCFGTGILPGVFERFLASQGFSCDLNINFLMPEEILKGLRRGDHQFAVVEHCGPFNPGELVHFSLPPDTMLFVSSPPLGMNAETLDLDDLARQHLLLKTPHGCAYKFLEARLESIDRNMDDLPNISFYDDLPGLIRQVGAGMGLGFLSKTLITRELEEGLLRVHAVPELNNRRDRTLVLGPGEPSDPLVRSFAAVILDQLGMPIPAAFLPSEA